MNNCIWIWKEDTHHEYMKCTNCLKIIEFDDSELHNTFDKLAKKHKFELNNHTLNFEWICSDYKK